MFISTNAYTKNTYHSGAFSDSILPSSETALKVIAGIALLGMTVTLILEIYLVVIATGLIAITALAILHFPDLQHSTYEDRSNSCELHSPKRSTYAAKKTPITQPVQVIQQSQDELDNLENTPDKIRQRVAQLRKYDDKPWQDIPADARNDNKHEYWNKYDINHPASRFNTGYTKL